MPSNPAEVRLVRQTPYARLLPIALSLIVLDAVVAGVPVLNYVIGLLALASYPVLFMVSSQRVILAAAAVSVAVSAMFSGSAGVMSMSLSVTIPGIIMGMAMRGRKTADRAIMMAFMPSIVMALLFLVNRSELQAAFSIAVDETIAQLSTVPGVLPSGDDAGQLLKSFGETVFSLMPSLILLSGLFNVFLGYIVAQRMLRGHDFERLPKFTTWRPSYKLVFLFIAGLFLAVAGIGGSGNIGGNILVFTGIIYFVSGLAVVENFFLKSKMPLAFKLLFYMGIFFAQLFSLVVLAGVGLFDSWFNFRGHQIDEARNSRE